MGIMCVPEMSVLVVLQDCRLASLGRVFLLHRLSFAPGGSIKYELCGWLPSWIDVLPCPSSRWAWLDVGSGVGSASYPGCWSL